jgi:hypothetical protein
MSKYSNEVLFVTVIFTILAVSSSGLIGYAMYTYFTQPPPIKFSFDIPQVQGANCFKLNTLDNWGFRQDEPYQYFPYSFNGTEIPGSIIHIKVTYFFEGNFSPTYPINGTNVTYPDSTPYYVQIGEPQIYEFKVQETR